MRVIPLLLIAALILTGAPPARRPAAAAPPLPECRPQSGGERPSATADDITDCVFARLGPGRVRLSVAYTYASPLGKQNIWMGLDVLAGGNRLKWFSYRPVAIASSGGNATFEVIFGVNSPPARTLATDQVEFFLYVGGGQIFYRRLFNVRLDWSL